MPRHSTSTSFKYGHKRSRESIEKQRLCIIEQYKLGRKPPKPIWTNDSKNRMIESNRATSLLKKPIGSKRIHKSKHDLNYYEIKVSDRGKWMLEHRFIMSNHLNRPLLKTEIVHHINKNTLDNRIENLELVNYKIHKERHPTSKETINKMVESIKLNGKWSRKFKECIICHTVKNIHVSRGRCATCYRKNYI